MLQLTTAPYHAKPVAPDYLRWPAVQVMVGFSHSWAYQLMAEGAFPRPFKIGKRAVAWRRVEVEKWLRNRPRA